MNGAMQRASLKWWKKLENNMPKKEPQISEVNIIAALGGVDATERARYESVFKLFAKRNAVLDKILSFDERVNAVRGLDSAVEKYLDKAFGEIAIEFSESFGAESDVGENDLQRAAITREYEKDGTVRRDEIFVPEEIETKGALFQRVAGTDRIKRAISELEALKKDEQESASILPWYKTLAKSSLRRQAKQQTVAKMSEIQEQAAKRGADRIAAAERIEKNWNGGKLDALEKQLEILELVLHGLELIRGAEQGTFIQKVSADSCRVALERLARKPDDNDNQELARTRIKQLEVATNIDERAQQLREELREIDIEMRREMATVDTEARGIGSIEKLLPTKVFSTTEERELAQQKLAKAAEVVKKAYDGAHAFLEKLQEQLAHIDVEVTGNAQELHGVVEALAAGNVRELWTADFYLACKKARTVLENLRIKLKIQNAKTLPKQKTKLAFAVDVQKVASNPILPDHSSSEGEFANLNETEALRLGLERVEIVGNPQAQDLVNRIIGQTTPRFDVANTDDKISTTVISLFATAWKAAAPNIPVPCVPGKYVGYIKALATGRIISNLDKDHKIISSPQFDKPKILWIESWEEGDYNNEQFKTTASPLLKELGINATGIKVNISRETVDAALWTGDPSNKQKTPRHLALIRKLGLNPDHYNFRLIAQDEYTRLAAVKNFGKSNLWTMFNDYWVQGETVCSLDGGSRVYGGASGVGYGNRGNAYDDLAVRLVLERNN